MQVQIVTPQNWPRVRALMVDSLYNLDFYKDIVQDAATRKEFVRDYLDSEQLNCQLKGTGIFWCLTKQENPCRCQLPARPHIAQHAELLMAAKLKLPRGFKLKLPLRSKMVSSFTEAESSIRAASDQECEHSMSKELLRKYPEACRLLTTYNDWYKKYIQEISRTTVEPMWQGYHISVAPEHRMRGMATVAMQEAIKYFAPLAAATRCQKLLVNTGVNTCRFVCKNVGFEDLASAKYRDRTRWVMLMDMRVITQKNYRHTTYRTNALA